MLRLKLAKMNKLNIHLPLTPLWGGGAAGGAPRVEMADWHPSWILCQAPWPSFCVSGQGEDVSVLLSMVTQRECIQSPPRILKLLQTLTGALAGLLVLGGWSVR